MSQEDYPVELVLDGIESMMAPANPQPKVLLFDIGGVCVLSPFQAILDYELSHSIPPGWINTCISKSSPNGYWQRLERGELPMDMHFFHGFTQDLHSASLWDTFYAQARSRDPSLPATTPPLPRIDGEQLFWSMMTAARHPDPWMFPALKKLRASGRYILAALSNTVIYPSDHPLATAHDDVRAVFDLFISSAHVGMRKPEPRIYDLALRELDRFARENVGRDDRDTRGWERGVSAEEVVFLDDIGENLKAAKTRGFRTIKVHLGRAFEAVDQLEELTGLKLAGDHPRIAVMPKTNAKL